MLVDVVMCFECKNRGIDLCPFHIPGTAPDDILLKKLDEDYCSYGERKTGREDA